MRDICRTFAEPFLDRGCTVAGLSPDLGRMVSGSGTGQFCACFPTVPDCQSRDAVPVYRRPGCSRPPGVSVRCTGNWQGLGQIRVFFRIPAGFSCLNYIHRHSVSIDYLLLPNLHILLLISVCYFVQSVKKALPVRRYRQGSGGIDRSDLW